MGTRSLAFALSLGGLYLGEGLIFGCKFVSRSPQLILGWAFIRGLIFGVSRFYAVKAMVLESLHHKNHQKTVLVVHHDLNPDIAKLNRG